MVVHVICSQPLPAVHMIWLYIPSSKCLFGNRASKATEALRTSIQSTVHTYAFHTSFTSAPVFLTKLGHGIIEEILCAKMHWVNFDNSEDHTFVVNILSVDTQLNKHPQVLVLLFFVILLVSPPINIRSGFQVLDRRPSAKKFWIGRIWSNSISCIIKILLMASAVRTGSVDFFLQFYRLC
jgi:hypothetical protein